MVRPPVQKVTQKGCETIKGVPDHRTIARDNDIQFQEQCMWKSDVPTILSVCLVSMEPDSVLRVMPDQYTPGVYTRHSNYIDIPLARTSGMH